MFNVGFVPLFIPLIPLFASSHVNLTLILLTQISKIPMTLMTGPSTLTRRIILLPNSSSLTLVPQNGT